MCNVFFTALWITKERGNSISSKLLSSVITRNIAVAGMLTSHPYAIRSLEKVSNTSCKRDLIVKSAHKLQNVAGISYFQTSDIDIDDGRCVCRDDFQVDHSEINKILQDLKDKFVLGPLADGEEFIAVVFPGLKI